MAEDASPRFRLLGDQPHTEGADPLGFAGMADGLADLILSSAGSTPFTLGIEAGWGTGKSSLMRRIEQRLRNEPGVTTVWFNAWTAPDGEVLEGLIKSVLDRIDPNIIRRALNSKRLGKGLRIGARLVAGALRMDRVVDEIWDSVSGDPSARNELRELMQVAMEDWLAGGYDIEAGRLLVIFVDDLDRCSAENVLQVFEAMKLYLDAPGFVFVVGYDRAAVAESIQKGHAYMEKIIQIVHRIGSPSEQGAADMLAAYAESRTLATRRRGSDCSTRCGGGGRTRRERRSRTCPPVPWPIWISCG